MSKFDITETFFYRWRYYIGYFLVAIGLIATLLFVVFYLPGGISVQEQQSTVKSSILSIGNAASVDVVNLPYHLLQKISIKLFGVSILSIKLPSMIIAFISIIALVFMLRQWFKPNISILASLIAITTGQFLFIAQNGTPDVLYLLWPALLLLLASLITKQQKHRTFFVIMFFITAALSLYTPLSIYVLLVFAITILIHPHLRFIIRKLPKIELAEGFVAILLIVSPLLVGLFNHPGAILTLLGVPLQWPDLWANLTSLGTQYFGFLHPGGTTIITPFFELGSMLIIAIGAYRVFKTRATAKSLSIIFWIICLIPVIILNPELTDITCIPLIILLASGLNELLSYWYGLFPNNPYARITGLIPVVILVSALVFSGINRYVYSYRYSPDIAPNFSHDLQLIPSDTKYLVVTDNELSFYSIVAKYNKQFIVSNAPSSTDSFLATRAAKKSFEGYTIDKIITSSLSNDSDRLYTYKKVTE